MRKLLLLAGNDLRLTVRNRAALVWMLLMPVALTWFMGSRGGGGKAVPALRVVDRDGGWLAQAFVEQLDGRRLDLEVAGAGSTSRLPARRQAPKPLRTLIIPAGFTREVLAGHREALRLESAADAAKDFTLAAEVQVVRAIGHTLGSLSAMAAMAAMADHPAASQAGAGPAGAAALAEFRAQARVPPLVTVAVTSAGRGQAVPAGMAQSVPGILTMTVLMMTLIYGAVFLTIEKRDGLLRRQSTLPLTRGQIYAGKLLGRFLMASVQIAILLAAGRFLFGLALGRSPAGLAMVLVAYAAAVAGLSTLLGAVLHTPEQASAVGWLASMLLAGLGGCWWPGELAPRWLWTASHVLPTPWAMDAFHSLISFGRGAGAVVLPAAVLCAFGVLFALLGARFLRYT